MLVNLLACSAFVASLIENVCELRRGRETAVEAVGLAREWFEVKYSFYILKYIF
jgi:hypothetical protein